MMQFSSIFTVKFGCFSFARLENHTSSVLLVFAGADVQFEPYRCTPGLYVSEALSEFDLCVFDVAYGKFYVELSIINIDVDKNSMLRGDVCYI